MAVITHENRYLNSNGEARHVDSVKKVGQTKKLFSRNPDVLALDNTSQNVAKGGVLRVTPLATSLSLTVDSLRMNDPCSMML